MLFEKGFNNDQKKIYMKDFSQFKHNVIIHERYLVKFISIFDDLFQR